MGSGSKSRVGVVIVGHGATATGLLAAARGIVGDQLDEVVAVDAGRGQTPKLSATLCRVLSEEDRGRGVLLIVDLLGASPCSCGLREGADHTKVLLSGLNLAMLLKLANLDREATSALELAVACADSATRSIVVQPHAKEPT
ncbi:MAG TPA: hypothetical protein ENK31_04965 [Nannocystis exedens]|nr:hypothetical protein [Nannocystis exedens]